MENVIRRGLTYYARFRVPEDRWQDVGLAMNAPGGVRREVVRTLGSTDARVARQKRNAVLASIQAEIDAALRKAGRRPLTDWTANDWMDRAVDRRASLERSATDGHDPEHDTTGHDRDAPLTDAEIVREVIEREADDLEARRGHDIAAQFLNVALGEGLSVAGAKRQWMAFIKGTIREQTLEGHEAALDELGDYLNETRGWASLEAITLGQVSKRMAGEFIAFLGTAEPLGGRQRKRNSAATVQKKAAAYNGLWKWASRRGYVETNPWTDQTAGMKAQRDTDADDKDDDKRGYTAEELETLLRATGADWAPNRGGYGATFWDLVRLLLLTGARPGELLGMSIKDILASGTAIAVAASRRGGKTKNAKRIIPLHKYAASVIASRLASLPDTSPDAPLWPEVPVQGADRRRTKTITTRFIPLRQRLLPASDDVDMYSLRRVFFTAADTAQNARGRIDPSIIARLGGHGQGHLALDVYSDWSRLGRPDLSGELLPKLAILANAVDDIVALGLPDRIRQALADTENSRPAMMRFAPAFSRA